MGKTSTGHSPHLKSPAVNFASASEKAASLITSPISILVCIEKKEEKEEERQQRKGTSLVLFQDKQLALSREEMEI